MKFTFEIKRTKKINYFSDIKIHDIVRHKSGDLYEVLEVDIKCQVNGKWCNAILYKKFCSQDLTIKFVRSFEDFKNSFEIVKLEKILK